MASKTDAEKQPPGLYLISPALEDAAHFAAELEAALAAADIVCVLLNVAGVDPGAAKKIIQTLAPLAQARGTAVLIDGDARLVARAGADGVHLRASGETLERTIGEAVDSLKPDLIVGVGGLRTRHDAMTAGEEEIDYVMFGAPSADDWTPPLDEVQDRVAWWSEIFTVPCIAFATKLEDVGGLAAAGADFIALGAAVWSDARGPAAAVRDAVTALRNSVEAV